MRGWRDTGKLTSWTISCLQGGQVPSWREETRVEKLPGSSPPSRGWEDTETQGSGAHSSMVVWQGSIHSLLSAQCTNLTYNPSPAPGSKSPVQSKCSTFQWCLWRTNSEDTTTELVKFLFAAALLIHPTSLWIPPLSALWSGSAGGQRGVALTSSIPTSHLCIPAGIRGLVPW